LRKNDVGKNKEEQIGKNTTFLGRLFTKKSCKIFVFANFQTTFPKSRKEDVWDVTLELLYLLTPYANFARFGKIGSR
jgi:hypothetical protein